MLVALTLQPLPPPRFGIDFYTVMPAGRPAVPPRPDAGRARRFLRASVSLSSRRARCDVRL